jgi:glycosyltransferase involved in cell wall biosynthesis
MHGSCFAEALQIPGWKEKVRMALLGCSEVLATGAAHRTVCVSENTRRYYPWARRVIPNGVDVDSFHPGGEKEERPTILFVGTYKNRKRGHLVLKAFAETIQTNLPSAQLWMVCGDAPAAPGVTVFGRVPEEKLAELYRRAWVFCLPSSYEGFGVPYIEAMASGIPVVATPNPGAVEVLDGGRYGRIVEPEALGEALLALLRSDTEREILTNAGIQRAQEYAWPRIVDQYAAVYRDCGC